MLYLSMNYKLDKQFNSPPSNRRHMEDTADMRWRGQACDGEDTADMRRRGQACGGGRVGKVPVARVVSNRKERCGQLPEARVNRAGNRAREIAGKAPVAGVVSNRNVRSTTEDGGKENAWSIAARVACNEKEMCSRKKEGRQYGRPRTPFFPKMVGGGKF